MTHFDRVTAFPLVPLDNSICTGVFLKFAPHKKEIASFVKLNVSLKLSYYNICLHAIEKVLI